MVIYALEIGVLRGGLAERRARDDRVLWRVQMYSRAFQRVPYGVLRRRVSLRGRAEGHNVATVRFPRPVCPPHSSSIQHRYPWRIPAYRNMQPLSGKLQCYLSTGGIPQGRCGHGRGVVAACRFDTLPWTHYTASARASTRIIDGVLILPVLRPW